MVSTPDPDPNRASEFVSQLRDFEHALARVRHHIELFGRPADSAHPELDAALNARHVKLPEGIDQILAAAMYPLTAGEVIAELLRLQFVAAEPSEQRIRETFSKCHKARGWVKLSDRGTTKYTTVERARHRGLIPDHVGRASTSRVDEG